MLHKQPRAINGEYYWGLCPQTPRVYRFKQKNEVILEVRGYQ
jgi:hypothetical protein